MTPGSMTPPQAWGQPQIVTPPHSPRSSIVETSTPLVPLSPRVLQTVAVAPSRGSPRCSVPAMASSVPLCATVQARIRGDGPDKVTSVAVVTAWSELAPPGQLFEGQLVTARQPLELAAEPSPRGASQPRFGNSSGTSVDVCTVASGTSFVTQGASSFVAAPLDRTQPEQHERQASSSRPSSPRLAALEARCSELEKNAKGKDAQLQELHDMAQRTAQELERRERQVEELKLNCSALTQKLKESETETTAIAHRARELESEVERLAAFREERERRRRSRSQEQASEALPEDFTDFDRAVREVNKQDHRDYRDLPTLAALRHRLYDTMDLPAVQPEASAASAQRDSATSATSAEREFLAAQRAPAVFGAAQGDREGPRGGEGAVNASTRLSPRAASRRAAAQASATLSAATREKRGGSTASHKVEAHATKRGNGKKANVQHERLWVP